MSQRFEMRLSDELAARIDEARGDVPRATWIKRAIEVALSEEPLRSPEALAALKKAWDSPVLEEQLREDPPPRPSPRSKPLSPAMARQAKLNAQKGM